MFVSRRYLPLTGIDAFTARFNGFRHLARRCVVQDTGKGKQRASGFAAGTRLPERVAIRQDLALLGCWQGFHASNSLVLQAHWRVFSYFRVQESTAPESARGHKRGQTTFNFTTSRLYRDHIVIGSRHALIGHCIQPRL